MRVMELLARSSTVLRSPGSVISTPRGVVGRLALRVRTWAFLSGNRRHIALGLLVLVYVALLVAGTIWPFEMQRLLTEESTVQQLMNTLLGGVILLVSIVVSVNALVLSEELAPIGSQHNRVKEAWTYRTRSARAVGNVVSPAAPGAFLEEMVDTVDRYTDLLARQLPAEDREVRRELEQFIDDVEAYIDATREVVGGRGFYTSGMQLFAAAHDPIVELEYARELRERESLPEDTKATLDVVIDGLEFFTSAREYFKTMYYKREYARLSRDLLYTGVPSVMLMSYLILALTGDVLPGTTLWFSNIYLFFSLAYVLSLSPFFVLAAYVIRGAIIAENTISAGGFVVE